MNERERIEKIIIELSLSARQFAEQIKVQPGTISNMMSGRNNPSLDVMKRIMSRYPTLNPEWLILGKGEMWRTIPGYEPQLFDKLPPTGKVSMVVRTQKEMEPQITAVPPKEIKNIVVYYTDGTYQEYSLSNNRTI